MSVVNHVLFDHLQNETLWNSVRAAAAEAGLLIREIFENLTSIVNMPTYTKFYSFRNNK